MSNTFRCKTLIFTVAVVILSIYSCSPKRAIIKTNPKPIINKKQLIHRLKKRARSLHSMSATAMVQVSYNGRVLPWVRCRLYWAKFQDRVVIRVIGLGFFGQKMFDFLAGAQAIYLYIPSTGKVFTSTYSEASILLGFDPLLLGKELKWLLQPYCLVNKRPKKLRINRINAWLRVSIGNFRYATERIDLFDCSIKNLSLPQLRASYQNYAYLNANIYYPQYIVISSKIKPFSIRIKLESIMVNNISCANSVFNATAFLKLPLAPLSLLFMNIT